MSLFFFGWFFFFTTDGHSGGSFVPCTKSIKDLQVGWALWLNSLRRETFTRCTWTNVGDSVNLKKNHLRTNKGIHKGICEVALSCILHTKNNKHHSTSAGLLLTLGHSDKVPPGSDYFLIYIFFWYSKFTVALCHHTVYSHFDLLAFLLIYEEPFIYHKQR